MKSFYEKDLTFIFRIIERKKVYKCITCQKTFARSDSLKNHEEYVHKKEKTYRKRRNILKIEKQRSALIKLMKE